jgi:hypothetical protein
MAANTKTMPMFTISRSQNRFLKNSKSTLTTKGYQHHNVKRDKHVLCHFNHQLKYINSGLLMELADSFARPSQTDPLRPVVGDRSGRLRTSISDQFRSFVEHAPQGNA